MTYPRRVRTARYRRDVLLQHPPQLGVLDHLLQLRELLHADHAPVASIVRLRHQRGELGAQRVPRRRDVLPRLVDVPAMHREDGSKKSTSVARPMAPLPASSSTFICVASLRLNRATRAGRLVAEADDSPGVASLSALENRASRRRPRRTPPPFPPDGPDGNDAALASARASEYVSIRLQSPRCHAACVASGAILPRNTASPPRQPHPRPAPRPQRSAPTPWRRAWRVAPTRRARRGSASARAWPPSEPRAPPAPLRGSSPSTPA